MKLIFTLFLAFLTAGLSASTVNSKVKEVRIFLNQAEVTRTADIKFSSGSQMLVLGGISTFIDPKSVQVKGKGDFVILGTSYQRNYLAEENPPLAVQRIKDSINLVSKKLSLINNEKEALTQEEELLKANKVMKGENGSLTAQELKSMAEFYGTRIQAIRNELYDLGVKQAELDELLKRLKKQLSERNNDFQKVNGEIVVEVKTSKPVTGFLEVTYIVSGASWQPEYDLRAKGVGEPLTLSYKAQIQQNTGEDWTNVDLTLSTANPSVGGYLPVFYPWYLDLPQPIMYKSGKSDNLSQALQGKVAGVQMDMVSKEPEAESLTNYVSTIEATLSVEYDIDVPYTILSGQKPTMVSIRDQSVEAEYIYQAMPRISTSVYLVAKVKEWSSIDLLPGMVNVFFEGGFVNKTYLNPESVEEKLAISLGVDNSIEVERKELKDLTKRQTIGANKKINYVYQLTVSNEKKKEIHLELIDQVPVTKNSAIEISIEELSGGNLDQDIGKVTWDLTLPPLSKKVLELAYEVKHPKDKLVPGL